MRLLIIKTSSFIASIVGNNCSKVDQLWSILPVIYSWHFHYHNYLQNGVHNSRTLLLSILLTCWGIRLTFNFWRKGGYGNLIHHEEDYRWPIIRSKMHPLLFFVFNFTFIACYQVRKLHESFCILTFFFAICIFPEYSTFPHCRACVPSFDHIRSWNFSSRWQVLVEN
jgi:steroid 5-alpha reductase family enzyme